MKLLLRRILATFLVIAIILSVSNYAYQYLERRVYPYGMNRDFDKFSSMPGQISIGNTGSSHGQRGFEYQDVKSVGCFNFGMSSQTISYDERLICHYQDRLQKGGVIFIPVSYFSLYAIDETETPDFESKNQRYHYILWPGEIKHFSPVTYICARYIPVLSVDFLDWWWYIRDVAFHRPPQEPETVILSEQIGFEESAESAHTRHDYMKKNGELHINQEELEALYDIIEICRKHYVEPVLVTTPYRHEYNQKFSDEFYEAFYSDINTITQETGCRYMDYSHDVRFTGRDDYFYDADHLSTEGARMFTNVVLKEAGYSNE